MTEDEIRDLKRNYENALKRINGSSGKTAQGVEKAYGEAYQALVRAGLAPQLRARYRR